MLSASAGDGPDGAGAGHLGCGSGARCGRGGSACIPGSIRLVEQSGGEGHGRSNPMVEGVGRGTPGARLAARSWDVVRDDTRCGDAAFFLECEAQAGVLPDHASSSFLFLCSSCPCKRRKFSLRSARLISSLPDLPCRWLGAGEWLVKAMDVSLSATAQRRWREWLGAGPGGCGKQWTAPLWSLLSTWSVSSSRRTHAVRPRSPNFDRQRVSCAATSFGCLSSAIRS